MSEHDHWVLKYPLHSLVWNNECQKLQELLELDESSIQQTDCRGRSPLQLAVALCHIECARVLLMHGADATVVNKDHWSVLHEATATCDPQLVELILRYRSQQREALRQSTIPLLLTKLQEAPDFYIEMKWEFSSWVPLVSRLCPSDTYKVWKSGNNVRIDTTLLGFENMSWIRGKRSYVFKCDEDEVTFFEIDHDGETVTCETMSMSNSEDSNVISHHDIATRLTSPLVTTYMDVDKIAFERNKCGIWGWRTEAVESVNGYLCKVFSASNVELVTKTRTDHLSETDKKASNRDRDPLHVFLDMASSKEENTHISKTSIKSGFNPKKVTLENYLLEESSDDIGRPIHQVMKMQRFKATVWLCEDYPLNLKTQILPIIDLMATNNAHFRKLKDFITLQLPTGFPIKIETPLFHMFNARVTFSNINAEDHATNGVSLSCDNTGKYCSIHESCFDVPPTYAVSTSSLIPMQDDDHMLQLAIQQSILEGQNSNEQVTFMEALDHSNEDAMLQRAIEKSLGLDESEKNFPTHEGNLDYQLERAIEVSKKEQQEIEQRRLKEEEDLLAEVLALSLKDQ